MQTFKHQIGVCSDYGDEEEEDRSEIEGNALSSCWEDKEVNDNPKAFKSEIGGVMLDSVPTLIQDIVEASTLKGDENENQQNFDFDAYFPQDPLAKYLQNAFREQFKSGNWQLNSFIT